MGRYYSISKKLSEESAQRILGELRALEDVEYADFDEDFTGITIITKSGEYTGVMDRAVNIFAREGGGAELSFRRFIPA